MGENDRILQQIYSLLIYQSIFEDRVTRGFQDLLEAMANLKTERSSVAVPHRRLEGLAIHFVNRAISAYSSWFKTLAETNRSWQDYLVDLILLDENFFSLQLQAKPLSELPKALIAAAEFDLEILQNIYNLSLQELAAELQQLAGLTALPIIWELDNKSTAFLHREKKWKDSIAALADCYRSRGVGIYARYRAFRWQKQLIGINNPDPIQLSEIVGYEYPKEALIKNTEVLLSGYNALNVLLYGSRGSGKSSLVKALLSEYGDRGLRLIEVAKSDLADLPDIVDRLRDLPQKFIIFVDDLSFEEDDEAFKSLKVVLEGSLTAKAQNVVVYATSNRRHLVREYFVDRPRPADADEVHSWDTVQEKLSFSDRFGLTLTFEPANQDTYLAIVKHLASLAKIQLPPEDLEFRAKQWATRHNGRSGRTARQFIDFLQGEIKLGKG
jgi:uncharacterized protein